MRQAIIISSEPVQVKFVDRIRVTFRIKSKNFEVGLGKCVK
jgi:hypothetical protein